MVGFSVAQTLAPCMAYGRDGGCPSWEDLRQWNLSAPAETCIFASGESFIRRHLDVPTRKRKLLPSWLPFSAKGSAEDDIVHALDRLDGQTSVDKYRARSAPEVAPSEGLRWHLVPATEKAGIMDGL